MVAAAGEAEQERVERGRVRRGSRGGDGDELQREERILLRGHQLVQPRRRDLRRRWEHRRGCNGGAAWFSSGLQPTATGAARWNGAKEYFSDD